MRNKLSVVVDTNVFLDSWLDDDKNCNNILDLILNRKLNLLFSQDTIGELIYITKKYAIKNMSSEKPRIALLKLVIEMFYWSKSIDTSKTECPKINDPYDEMFLKTAIEGKANYLISEDRKSGMHKVELEGIRIVSSEEFVSMYERLCVG